MKRNCKDDFYSCLSLSTVTLVANTVGCWRCGGKWSGFGGKCAKWRAPLKGWHQRTHYLPNDTVSVVLVLCLIFLSANLPPISGTCQICVMSWPGRPTPLRCPVQVCPPLCTAGREEQLSPWIERKPWGFSWSSSWESEWQRWWTFRPEQTQRGVSSTSGQWLCSALSSDNFLLIQRYFFEALLMVPQVVWLSARGREIKGPDWRERQRAGRTDEETCGEQRIKNTSVSHTVGLADIVTMNTHCSSLWFDSAFIFLWRSVNWCMKKYMAVFKRYFLDCKYTNIFVFNH